MLYRLYIAKRERDSRKTMAASRKRKGQRGQECSLIVSEPSGRQSRQLERERERERSVCCVYCTHPQLLAAKAWPSPSWQRPQPIERSITLAGAPSKTRRVESGGIWGKRERERSSIDTQLLVIPHTIDWQSSFLYYFFFFVLCSNPPLCVSALYCLLFPSNRRLGYII